MTDKLARPDSIADDLREAIGTAEQPGRTAEPEENFETWAGRELAKGTSPEAIHVVKLMESDYRDMPMSFVEDCVQRAVQGSRSGERHFHSTDTRGVLSEIKGRWDEANMSLKQKKAEEARQARTDRQLDTLGSILDRVESLAAKRRPH